MKTYFKKFGHICDLKYDDDEAEGDSAGFRKYFNKWTTINPVSNLTLQHFESHSSIVSEQQFHWANHPLTIHPFSRLKFVWESLMVVVFLCGLIYVPLQYFDYVDGVEENNIGNLAIKKALKTICIFDMITRFFTGYLDEENSVVVLSKKEIAQTYFRGQFTFDFLSNFPFFIGLIVKVNFDNYYFHLIKLLNLFQILRLTTMVRYCERMFIRFQVDDRYGEIFKLFIYWLAFIHWAACLQIIPGIICADFIDGKKIGAWYEHRNFTDRNFFGRYVICLFKSVKTIMGTGYVKNLQPKRYFDKIYATLLVVIGRIALCVTLAYIYGIIQGMRSSMLRYDEMMVQLQKYTDHNNFSSSTTSKLKGNYNNIFCKRFFNEREILKTVSVPLRQEILINNTRHLVENSTFFENLPSFLIRKIISSLSIELYLEGDVVYDIGEDGLSVYFITSGSVAFYSPSMKEVCHFSDGDYFGEIALVSDIGHHYAKAVALETTECYKLGKNDFQKLVQSYPDLLQKVEELAIERIEQVLMIEEREKHRKPFEYTSINQQQFPHSAKSSML